MDWIASPRARTAGNGDFENGWNRSSWERTGVGSVGFDAGAFRPPSLFKNPKSVRRDWCANDAGGRSAGRLRAARRAASRVLLIAVW